MVSSPLPYAGGRVCGDERERDRMMPFHEASRVIVRTGEGSIAPSVPVRGWHEQAGIAVMRIQNPSHGEELRPRLNFFYEMKKARGNRVAAAEGTGDDGRWPGASEGAVQRAPVRDECPTKCDGE